ncbi:MAG: hypothetical protein JNK23_09395 [Opitutaceae bacterium]|nr:hypothetical protein [Opitutaceae bacterium]
MKTSVRLALAAFVSAPWLRAHPGHDGDHGLTWEFTHLAEHPLATLGWAALGLAVIAAGWWFARRLTQPAVQSLRTSQPSRGK